jgi:hypothetical protein
MPITIKELQKDRIVLPDLVYIIISFHLQPDHFRYIKHPTLVNPLHIHEVEMYRHNKAQHNS